MGAPVKKLFGSLSLDGIKKAVTEVPSKVGEYKGEKQLKVSAAEWEDGGISLTIWDAEKKESIRIGNLRISTLDDAPAPKQNLEPQEGDLPFQMDIKILEKKLKELDSKLSDEQAMNLALRQQLAVKKKTVSKDELKTKERLWALAALVAIIITLSI